jgi:hypothetical protein
MTLDPAKLAPGRRPHARSLHPRQAARRTGARVRHQRQHQARVQRESARARLAGAGSYRAGVAADRPLSGRQRFQAEAGAREASTAAAPIASRSATARTTCS